MVICVALGMFGTLRMSANCTPTGMSKLLSRWKACITVASSSSRRGAVLWKNAALMKREGGVMSPGNPCSPLPPPKASSDNLPICW